MSIGSIGGSIYGSSSSYASMVEQLVSASIQTQQQQMEQVQTKKSTLQTRIDAYQSLQAKLKAVNDAAIALRSGFGSVFQTMTGTSEDETVFTGTVTGSATPGIYAMRTTALAWSQRIASTLSLSSPDSALGKDGVVVLRAGSLGTLGGSRAVSGWSAGNGILTYEAAQPAGGFADLHGGDYRVELRKDATNGWQYRLLDSGGAAVSIKSNAGNTTTSAWQTIGNDSAVTIDTGRGLQFSLDAAASRVVGVAGSVTWTPPAAREITAQSAASWATGFATGNLGPGRREIGTGQYKLQMRLDPADGATKQYRLVDFEGQAVAIQKAADPTGSLTSSWQTLADGTTSIDTGRGLKIAFDTSAGLAGDATISYVAEAASIGISKTDTLSSIAYMISTATFAEGDEVKASAVNGRLVLESSRSGLGHSVQMADINGDITQTLGYFGDSSFTPKAEALLQAGRDAAFTVNGMNVTRSQNRGLANVIAGVNLNLLAEADHTHNLTIAASGQTVTDKVKTLVKAINEALAEISTQTKTTTSGSGDSFTYTRAPLSGQTTFTSLRLSLMQTVWQESPATADGLPRSLRALGVTSSGSGGTFAFSLSDEKKLAAAFASNPGAVESLVSSVSGQLETTVKSFVTGSTGYLDDQIKTLTASQAQLSSRISNMQIAINKQTATLRLRYTNLFQNLSQQQSNAQLGLGWRG